MRDYSKISNNVLRISYESLFSNPYDVLRILFQWLNFPISTKNIEKAMDFSSQQQVRIEEAKSGNAIHVRKGHAFTGSFVRSGKIGQWKDHFLHKEVEMLARLLLKYNIDLDEFVCE